MLEPEQGIPVASSTPTWIVLHNLEGENKLARVIFVWNQGSISCKMRPTLAPFPQFLIGIFSFLEAGMYMKIRHLAMLNFFT